jgi:Cu-Zn family superoxide dismutase
MKRITIFAAALAALSACAFLPPVPIAVAELGPTEGNKASGTATFVERSGKLIVDGHFKGLAPGQHGIHIHEKGDCSAPDGMSAGGHYNPTGEPHGALDSARHHGGDFGNLTADANGDATLSVTLDSSRIGIGKLANNTIAGKALVIHADPDDLNSQPAGNSGKRVACGVIQMQ